MASDVEICNRALAQLHVSGINSLDENSAQAQRCKLLYTHVRDGLLEDFDWQFNHQIKALALLTDTLFNWVYVY